MATLVKEIMNPELFSLRPADPVDGALGGILAMGITGAPVLDGDGRPIGMLSLRDVVGRREGDTAADRMTAPATVIRADAPISEAGRMLAETGRHRLVVVDGSGRASGIVSALDVLRGLLGLPAVHPAPFPHLDMETGLVWSDDVPLDLEHLDVAPERAGLLGLVHGGAGQPERVVWAEATNDLHGRLAEMLSRPQTDQPLLEWWLSRGFLRFRFADAEDSEKKARALRRLLHRARLPGLPSWI